MCLSRPVRMSDTNTISEESRLLSCHFSPNHPYVRT